jgi:osmotically-inducible protein OsmY
LTKLLLDKHELDGVLINVTVRDGNVRLWGSVENAKKAALAETAAKSLIGIITYAATMSSLEFRRAVLFLD